MNDSNSFNWRNFEEIDNFKKDCSLQNRKRLQKKTKTINSSIPLHLSNVSKYLLNNLRDQNKN